jgi:hypothetical protein
LVGWGWWEENQWTYFGQLQSPGYFLEFGFEESLGYLLGFGFDSWQRKHLSLVAKFMKSHLHTQKNSWKERGAKSPKTRNQGETLPSKCQLQEAKKLKEQQYRIYNSYLNHGQNYK